MENYQVRMFTTEQAAHYVGLGKTNMREWGAKIGAARKFGKSLRFDKKVIDSYLDKLETDKSTGENP